MKKIDELKAKILKAEKELESLNVALKEEEDKVIFNVGDFVEGTLAGERVIGELLYYGRFRRINGVKDIGSATINNFEEIGSAKCAIAAYSGIKIIPYDEVNRWKPQKGDLINFLIDGVISSGTLINIGTMKNIDDSGWNVKCLSNNSSECKYAYVDYYSILIILPVDHISPVGNKPKPPKSNQPLQATAIQVKPIKYWV